MQVDDVTKNILCIYQFCRKGTVAQIFLNKGECQRIHCLSLFFPFFPSGYCSYTVPVNWSHELSGPLSSSDLSMSLVMAYKVLIKCLDKPYPKLGKF